MDQGKKLVAILLALGVLIVGVRFYFIYQERHAPAVTPHREAPANGYQPTADDYTYLRQIHPESPKDIAELMGKTVWVQAADQLPCFPVVARHVDYAHNLGVLRGGTPLAVVGMIQQVPPHSLTTRVPNGDKQVLIAFTLPNDTKTYATPLGWHEGGDWHFIADQVLFYDDPHRLYSWSPKIWDAIDSHTVIPGMTEQQAGLAVGQVMTTDSQQMGDRTIHYDNLGHPVDVTFEKNHATSINPQKP
jgi:hypothetical protein